MDDLRQACAEVAARARQVRIQAAAIPAYADRLPLTPEPLAPLLTVGAEREAAAAHVLTLDAINFGSGWFPTLRKAPARSGYGTIAAGLEAHRAATGPWTAAELTTLDAAELAVVLSQDPRHELMALYARSLNDLGDHVVREHGGSFTALVSSGSGSAVGLARQLGRLHCFADLSRYEELELPFLKRAQIACADLERAGVERFADLGALTMFADNLVPHVLRIDGILTFDAGLTARIERGELIENGSPEEVEIRACALHAVELIVASRRDVTAAKVDQLLWNRGQLPRYKATPRHRSRCTAY